MFVSVRGRLAILRGEFVACHRFDLVREIRRTSAEQIPFKVTPQLLSGFL